MPAERGDRRPCLFTACTGEMQYGREAPVGRVIDNTRDGLESAEHVGAMGWRCSETAAHYRAAVTGA